MRTEDLRADARLIRRSADRASWELDPVRRTLARAGWATVDEIDKLRADALGTVQRILTEAFDSLDAGLARIGDAANELRLEADRTDPKPPESDRGDEGPA